MFKGAGFVPVVFAAAKLEPEAHTLLFVVSVLASVPLAAPLSHATESVAAKTGDAAGGLLNATLGNLTELVIAITALRAGEYMLVKASIAGAIVLWPGAVVMVLIATLTASFVTVNGRSAWFVGVLVLMVYSIFAMTLYLLPPRAQ
jgi:Ca2+/H+ antiporter